jgi:hypothetical protein
MTRINNAGGILITLGVFALSLIITNALGAELRRKDVETYAEICNPNTLGTVIRVFGNDGKGHSFQLGARLCTTYFGRNFSGYLCICQDAFYCDNSHTTNVFVKEHTRTTIGNPGLRHCPYAY